MQTEKPAGVGTPVMSPRYGREGFISAVKEVSGRFVIGSTFQPVRFEYEICWTAGGEIPAGIDTLSDATIAPMLETAARAHLPFVLNVSERRAEIAAIVQGQRDALKAAQDDKAAARAAFEADAASRIPSWAKAVIVGELEHDDSDAMTDYFNTTTSRVIILGFSKHTRDLFPEMRQAALNHPDTAFLASASASAENREKYSMGAGYYLKVGGRYSSGWKVRKRTLYDGVKSLPSGEWPPQAATPEAAPDPAAIAAGARIEKHRHTKKGFDMWLAILPARVDRAEYDRLLAAAKALGGWYSRPWGKSPGGFAFKEETAAADFLANLNAQ